MAEDTDEYNNSHRAFLQALFARQTITFAEAKPILAAIISAYERRQVLAEDIQETTFHNFITSINQAISPFDLEVRNAVHQTTGQKSFSLVNCTSDGLTQLSTHFSADEISYVKRVLDAIFETYNTPRHEIMAITSMQAMNLHRAPARDGRSRRETQGGAETQGSAGSAITQAQAQRVLRALVEQGWFEKSGRGFYSLSPRALTELRSWLVETYNDPADEEGEDEHGGGGGERVAQIKTCRACREIITMGQRCSRRSCPGRLHDVCTQNMFRMLKARKCPVCRADWIGEDFVGERAAPKTSKDDKRTRSEGGRMSPVLQPEPGQGDDEDDLEEGDDDG